jgi:hypothetical protein
MRVAEPPSGLHHVDLTQKGKSKRPNLISEATESKSDAEKRNKHGRQSVSEVRLKQGGREEKFQQTVQSTELLVLGTQSRSEVRWMQRRIVNLARASRTAETGPKDSSRHVI